MLEQKLAQHRQTIRERNFTIAEAKHLLDTLSKNNRETELSLSKARRRAFRLQQDVKEREKNCSRLKDEVRAASGEPGEMFEVWGRAEGPFLCCRRRVAKLHGTERPPTWRPGSPTSPE